jgi:ribonuclease VapC
VIAVDTSALMAIVLGGPEAELCMAALEAEPNVVMSAGTLAEALIVADRRNVAQAMAGLIDGLGIDVVTVISAASQRIASAYAQWGKGQHPAALNFGDCFASMSRSRALARCCSWAMISPRRI